MSIHGYLPPAYTPITDEEVKAHVESNFGAVDPESARRYLNKVYYGKITPSIGDETKQGISKLPTEMKVNMYEALAQEGNSDNLEYLDALNQEMGLTEEFYADQAEDVKTFFADTKKIEKMWHATSGTKGTFAAAMNQMINHGASMSEKDKKKVLTFAAKSYAKHMGLEEPKIEFFEDKPELHGYFKRETGVIGFNTKSDAFAKNPMQAFDTAFHEPKHMQQFKLAGDYMVGSLDANDPNYLGAHVFAAGLCTTGGYIPADSSLGHAAYARQPTEIAARHAGKKAVELATEKYGSPQRADDYYTPTYKVVGYNA